MATRTQDKIAKKNIKESHNISSYGTPTVGFGFVYMDEGEAALPVICEDEFGNFQPLIRSTNRDDTKTVRETHGIIRFTDTIDGE